MYTVVKIGFCTNLEEAVHFSPNILEYPHTLNSADRKIISESYKSYDRLFLKSDVAFHALCVLLKVLCLQS